MHVREMVGEGGGGDLSNLCRVLPTKLVVCVGERGEL